ncbi:rab-GTPase-TBC domain-containing protein [Sporodiniella umbellata]|nr:rab-GTPase-TBC domain-containing protein [Sporodiniella umbellata]
MTATEISRNDGFMNKEINNESSITIHASSFEEKCFSDAESSSLNTVASHQEKSLCKVKIDSGHFWAEPTEEDRVASRQSMIDDNENTKDLLINLQQMDQETSCSDSENSVDNFRSHKRHESHQSTMSSIHSFISSASNYDLLLARLDNNGSVLNTSNFIQNSTEDLRSYINIEEDKPPEDFDWEFWSKVISDFNGLSKSGAKELKAQIQKGIPPSLRGMIWQLLSKSKSTKLEEEYMQLLKEESVYEKAIMRDISKMTSLEDQHQKEALFDIAKAYSLYDKEVGYNQNILCITLPLLHNMPEEEAFCVLVQLMSRYGLRSHYLPQSNTILRKLYQLERLVGDRFPHLQKHLEINGIKVSTYSHSWFSTLFSCTFPIETIYRVYDIIFVEDVMSLFHFSLAVIERNQSILLSLEFDDLAHFLKNSLSFIYQDPNLIVLDALQVNIATKRLDRLARDFQVEFSKTNNEAQIIESLKKQNKQLQESVHKMDHDYNKLNEEHTRLASELISVKMDIVRIHDENEAYRQHTNDLKKTLEVLPTEIETRVKDEMESLYIKNAALRERNMALEHQLEGVTSMIIEIQEKHAESEKERKGLRQRLHNLKCLIEK